MKHLKQLAALAVLSGSLIAPAIAAEPMVPVGTTVDNIALTTVETNVTSMDANSAPAMMSPPPSAMPPKAMPLTPMPTAPDNAAQDMAGDSDADMAE